MDGLIEQPFSPGSPPVDNFANDENRSSLVLDIQAAQIFADHPENDKLDAAEISTMLMVTASSRGWYRRRTRR